MIGEVIVLFASTHATDIWAIVMPRSAAIGWRASMLSNIASCQYRSW
ncbi:unannotated protein [freshwater metagenome]|uniref:Unannotated protein n=1 Tax=freshwater metagenome TaxID=449393 RepID=A0A6J7UKC4_9ZZZZ